MASAVDDILVWSAEKLAPWRQDALRRLACSSALSATDYDDLLALVKVKAGFTLAKKPPNPSPLTKAHFAVAAPGAAIQVKTIRNVKNVNRLVPSAELKFSPTGVTVVYGRNGSGKSGFVRIFRTACRTRIDSPAKLKVLADVYGTGGGPQEAEIVIDEGGAETVIPWKAGGKASDALMQVAVFDSSAAELYVDSGNQIEFLPFGLALPYKLNEICLTLKEKLEAERRSVTQQLALATVDFDVPRATKAQAFYGSLSQSTSDDKINESTKFSEADQVRLDELARLLSGGAASAADLRASSTAIQNLGDEAATLYASFADTKIAEYRTIKSNALDAGKAADVDATAAFPGEPLPGVGSETWRRLWIAARAYSLEQAYPGQDFPVVNDADGVEICVLCHQQLSPEAAERLKRFESFVSGKLTTDAEEAEIKVTTALSALTALKFFAAVDWNDRIKQIEARTVKIAEAVAAFKLHAEQRRAEICAILQPNTPLPEGEKHPAWESPSANLKKLAEALAGEATAIEGADNAAYRQKLAEEKPELEDRKALAGARDRIIKRRDLLKEDALYAAALAEVQTTGITKKANELVDVYLTKAVLTKYDDERKALDIDHLKVSLARKSGQLKTSFQTNPGTTLTKLTSEILSEGEQRALALAAFFTEVDVTEGSGPIVIDDPVSSLDRQRGQKVAARIAQKAKKRQVIVFTHDLIFFNDLCRECDGRVCTRTRSHSSQTMRTPEGSILPG
jgi:energy-coupling factor transporter ATP-binding protein EcfA2